MQEFDQRVAVITGAASGFGREFARLGAQKGMKLVLADIEDAPLQATADELKAAGADVVALRTDVAKSDSVKALSELAYDSFGAVHLLFNNAGVAHGGLIWEASEKDWAWILGVNVMGVVHGMHHFVPRMLKQGEEGHIINTASVAGLLSAPLMGTYNVSKHSVVTLSETLYHDLKLVKSRLGVSVLCPAFVPTGIAHSHRNRPEDLRSDQAPTESMKAAQASSVKAVSSGKKTAADIASLTFAAIHDDKFYILSHPGILGSVELRLQDVLNQRNPTDPFAFKPDAKPQL